MANAFSPFSLSTLKQRSPVRFSATGAVGVAALLHQRKGWSLDHQLPCDREGLERLVLQQQRKTVRSASLGSSSILLRTSASRGRCVETLRSVRRVGSLVSVSRDLFGLPNTVRPGFCNSWTSMSGNLGITAVSAGTCFRSERIRSENRTIERNPVTASHPKLRSASSPLTSADHQKARSCVQTTERRAERPAFNPCRRPPNIYSFGQATYRNGRIPPNASSKLACPIPTANVGPRRRGQGHAE